MCEVEGIVITFCQRSPDRKLLILVNDDEMMR